MQEIINEIPWPVVAPILVIQLILIVVALIDLARAQETNGPKWLWLLIIVFFNLIGPVLYFVVGRRQN